MFSHKIKNFKTIILLISVFAIGGAVIFWVATSTEGKMRAELITEARIAAQALNMEYVASLSGSNSDLDKPAYQRIKTQLSSIRKAIERYRFIYLMGRRSDGIVFFFVDSLPQESKDYAPPGLVYDEVPDSYIRIFENKKEAVVGPITDRWGTLITALVPLKDPSSGDIIALLGMDVDATYWNKTIIGRCIFPFIVILLFGFLILLLLSREKVAKSLRQSENKLRATLDATPFPVAVVDLNDDKIFYWSRSALELFGHTAPTTQKWYQIAYPDPEYRSNVIIRWKSFLEIARQSNQAVNTGEYRITCKDGSVRTCCLYATFLTDNFIVTFNDITERKRAQVELLHRSEFEQLVAEISSELARVSGGGIDSVIDHALASIGAFTVADRAYVFQFNNIGTHVDNTHEWCADGVEPQIKNLKNIPIADELPWFLEQLRKHGIFHVPSVGALQPEALLEREHFEAQDIKSLIVIPMKTSGNLTGFIGFDAIYEHRTWSDDDLSLLRFIGETISHVIDRKQGEEERKKLQTQLIQAQKMESIGTLAGGIAHDFNNILSSIIGFTELALNETEKNSSIEESLKEVYAAGNRAKDLVKQILAFARKTEEETKPVKLQAIAEGITRLLRSSIPTSIEIITKFESNGLIMGNTTQLHQIIMNLCTNAAHAMEERGGTLTISTKDVDLDQTPLTGYLKTHEKRYVRFQVSDTGTGIPAEIINSIFEPYFTTKKTGEGTGMGLAMVQGIVESYGGNISVDSTLGSGSTFTIHLPLTTQSATQREHEPETLPTGTERILVVDDEAPIVKMSSLMLEGLGYQVTARFSSTDALELFKVRPADFDLVITDMTMPDMTGDELAIEMMRVRSDIPVILCTGYSKRISDELAYDIGIKALVNKPFVRADLAKAVRNVLDENLVA